MILDCRTTFVLNSKARNLTGKKMTDCVIVDIDGTLADCHHRQRHINKSPRDWTKFLSPELVCKDKLIEPIARLVNSLVVSHTILYASGRPDTLRETTIDWLSTHDLWFPPFQLYMRRGGDKRPDVVVKREILNEIRADGFDPWLSIDDRAAVVEMWRDEGLTCLQVADGDF